MLANFNRIFNRTPEQEEEDRQRSIDIYEQLSKDKGCSTCAHCKHIMSYPGYITGEECECTAGLKCDTVFFTVTNCPQWVKRRFYELT